MTGWIARLGPGLMLAAAAVGVSHLVQSSRAGADFGLSFVWLVVLISVLKYPAFRFAVDYASLTNHSLVYAYSKLGRMPMLWLLIGFMVDMFIATAAVSLVTAGLLISVFGLPFSGPQVAIAVTVVSALVLVNGQYARAERLNDRAEKIQESGARMMASVRKALVIILPIVFFLLVYLTWLIMR